MLFRAALACIAAATLVAGCGGGGSSASSAKRVITTQGGRSITVPSIDTTAQASHGGGATTTAPSTLTLPNGSAIQVGQLTPFRDCLRDHGVTAAPVGQAARTPFPTRSEMHARLACAPKLPPALEHLYLRARRHFQKRLHAHERRKQ